MATAWSALTPRILIETPRCSIPLAEQSVLDAAIDFCDRSFIYQIDHAAIDGVANTGEYAWAPGTNLKVVRPEVVWYDKKPLTPKTRDELATLYAYWPDQVGTPLYFVQEKLEKLILVPKPAANLTGGILAKVSVRPSRNATDIDDAIYDRYMDAIVNGAKARLFWMEGQAWSNAEKAAACQGLFEAAADRARLAMFKGMGRARNNQTRGYKRFM